MHPDDADQPASTTDGFDAVEDLLDVLDLTHVAPGDATDEASAPESPLRGVDAGTLGQPYDEFVGRSQPQPHGRVFGGQVVAQSVIAAGRTVADIEGPPRHIHSLHGYFLRAGDASAPIRFAVERLRDGHSFSARRVHALQYGRPILSMIFSFQTHSGGLDHQDEMPHVPPPEDLPTMEDLLAKAPEQVRRRSVERRAIDMRFVDGPLYGEEHERVSRQSVWLRCAGPLPDDPLLNAAILAYASDFTLLEATLRRHGINWLDPRLRIASLDHSMWFHRPVHADDWILYAQASPSASGGRGLGIGRMFSRDGTLVASVGQEGMVRLKD